MTDVICVPKFSYIGARNLHTELPSSAALAWRGLIRSGMWVLRSRRGPRGWGPSPAVEGSWTGKSHAP